jgi:hypothetical protein
MSNEIWKDVMDFEGRYQVSDFGRIKSFARNKLGIIITPYKTQFGYHAITLRINKKLTYRFIHRVVATAFIPNPNNKPSVNHKNGIRTDNRLDNLEWCTAKENTQDGIRRQTIKVAGDNSKRRKINYASVLLIRQAHLRGEPMKSIARQHGLCIPQIWNICNYKSWRKPC